MVTTGFLWLLLSITAQEGVQAVIPTQGQTLESSLTAVLCWESKLKVPEAWDAIRLTVSEQPDFSRPILDIQLDAKTTSHRMAVRPSTRYFWQVIPYMNGNQRKDAGFQSDFISGTPKIDATASDCVRYKNPRSGAHWLQMEIVPHGADEPLSPWYSVKKYTGEVPPTFEQLRSSLPEPVWDGHSDALDVYWYCWKILCGVWSYAPAESDHQAVANILGIRTWGEWGSTMVFDSAFITYFAKYAHHGYSFIQGFDNCYARQHENGFICRESDRANREVYVVFPVNPPLFSWAEWEYYRLSGDKKRLAEVFLPIVKHYEWYMTYQRRENGLYWTNGAQEADDSPRNSLTYYAVSATSHQALAALCLAKIARTIGRDDMGEFFEAEHAALEKLVNENFWDKQHNLYNDKTSDGQFITELSPGKFCKHCHMFWPMLAQIAPPDHVAGMVAELNNPASFFRRNGVASLSADSEGYTGGPEGSGGYWRGSVWPPVQCMVQEGLTASGQRELASRYAEKYNAAVVETFAKQHDITEYLAPDQPLACGCGQFVGWGGIGPVANLIEYLLGFDIHVPEHRVVWHINRLERHGIKNLWVGSATADLICEARTTRDDACSVHIHSDGPFTLVLETPHGTREVQVQPGDQTVVLQ